MSKLDQLISDILHLEERERSYFWLAVASDNYVCNNGIESHPDICGGEPCIVRTRIPVWSLIQSQKLGMNDAEILRCYPTLRAEDLVNARNYAYRNGEEIHFQIRENESA
jgi:uncharacterized protein (DUF433 family)